MGILGRTNAAHRAREKVRLAVKSGRLFRPLICEDCFEEPRPRSDGRSGIHAHHHLGYEHPLDVRWLCARCHAKYDPRLSGEAASRRSAKSAKARLTEADVREIRRLRPVSSLSVLARQFKVSRTNIIKIAQYQNWKYVGSAESANLNTGG